MFKIFGKKSEEYLPLWAGHASAVASSARRLFVGALLRRVTNTHAANLRRRAATQLSSGNPAPFFALVGISLASGTSPYHLLVREDGRPYVLCIWAKTRFAKCWKTRFFPKTYFENYQKLDNLENMVKALPFRTTKRFQAVGQKTLTMCSKD